MTRPQTAAAARVFLFVMGVVAGLPLALAYGPAAGAAVTPSSVERAP